jgi:hypothetical protein
MMHMDLNTTNAIIAARQDAVRQMMSASRQQGDLMPRIGVLLVRIGERLQRDVAVASNAQPPVPAPKRPQLA